MIKHVPLIGLLAFSIATVAPSASAMTASQARECRAMSASLQVRQNEASERVSERDELLVRVETAGDEWEAAEEMRLFAAAHALDADTKKAVYEDLKSDLMRREVALQSSVTMINSDIAAYRARCVKN